MSTLSSSLHIARSSLGATQAQLSVTANNIANADTDGYTAKSARQTANVTNGTSSGVNVDRVISKVSQYILSDLLGSTSDTAGALKTFDMLKQTQSALGALTDKTGDGTSIANAVLDFENAMTTLAATPESTSLANAAIGALEDLVNQINGLSEGLQDQINLANDEVVTGVDTANAIISKIDSLNHRISTLHNAGQSTADLEDQLNNALVELSEYMEIKTFKNEDGGTKVYSASGQVMVDSTAHLLSTEEAPDGTMTISLNGADVTDRLHNGTLGALVTMRDETLPAYMTSLDELATTMKEALNLVVPGLVTGSSAADMSVGSSFLSDPASLLGTSDQETTAYALLDALQGDLSFDAAGKLGAGDRTLSEYASELLSFVVNDHTSAGNEMKLAQTELQSITDTMNSFYGVNVDEETERLSELKQLYSLASTLMSVIQEMFDQLLSSVR
ncbi:flagellar hook-associated protein 1 FlgK [Cohaesibacter sp. ES.047]|uniref:flagellar hook-associated protein FlgK n=1 Tax=Cohaesibacter sp. ES.047 TaxID=1798205 RepID=UPI000BB7C6AD|nr:flagellar hook-associated protein FlgK [Cohaesibacter sp. ES.047]SNY91749.1 flagellar hook-associated protein 1 FlgK [Cohaesibacter sp. ES.047]